MKNIKTETQLRREAERRNHQFSDSIGGCSSNYREAPRSSGKSGISKFDQMRRFGSLR